MATNQREEDYLSFDQDQQGETGLHLSNEDAIKYLTLLTPRDLNMQFSISPNTGDIALKTGSNAVKEAIKNLIMTKKLERPFQPGVGSSIRELLFEPNDIITEALIEEELRTVVENFEPRANILNIIVESERGGVGYRVKIIFSVIGTGDPVTFETFLEATRGE